MLLKPPTPIAGRHHRVAPGDGLPWRLRPVLWPAMTAAYGRWPPSTDARRAGGAAARPRCNCRLRQQPDAPRRAALLVSDIDRGASVRPPLRHVGARPIRRPDRRPAAQPLPRRTSALLAPGPTRLTGRRCAGRRRRARATAICGGCAAIERRRIEAGAGRWPAGLLPFTTWAAIRRRRLTRADTGCRGPLRHRPQRTAPVDQAHRVVTAGDRRPARRWRPRSTDARRTRRAARRSPPNPREYISLDASETSAPPRSDGGQAARGSSAVTALSARLHAGSSHFELRAT